MYCQICPHLLHLSSYQFSVFLLPQTVDEKFQTKLRILLFDCWVLTTNYWEYRHIHCVCAHACTVYAVCHDFVILITGFLQRGWFHYSLNLLRQKKKKNYPNDWGGEREKKNRKTERQDGLPAILFIARDNFQLNWMHIKHGLLCQDNGFFHWKCWRKISFTREYRNLIASLYLFISSLALFPIMFIAIIFSVSLPFVWTETGKSVSHSAECLKLRPSACR